MTDRPLLTPDNIDPGRIDRLMVIQELVGGDSVLVQAVNEQGETSVSAESQAIPDETLQDFENQELGQALGDYINEHDQLEGISIEMKMYDGSDGLYFVTQRHDDTYPGVVTFVNEVDMKTNDGFTRLSPQKKVIFSHEFGLDAPVCFAPIPTEFRWALYNEDDELCRRWRDKLQRSVVPFGRADAEHNMIATLSIWESKEERELEWSL